MITDSRYQQSLSFGDALFLYLERQGMPLHIASVSVFDGPVDFTDFTRFVAAKLPLVPRYRQRVQIPPLNLGLPVWSYDPDFDLANHVRQVDLVKGTIAEFQAVAARILSETMDHRRPLWDLTLVRGLEHDRTGLVVRVHHCLADGLAGIGLMNTLLDSSPLPPRLPRRSTRLAPPPDPAPPSLLDTLVRSSFSAVQQVLSAHSDLLSMAERLVAVAGQKQEEAAPRSTGDAAPTPEDLSRFLPEMFAPAQRLPFNTICRGPQKFHWTEIPVADIKAVKHACGATFNEVALAAVVSAVRRYAEVRGVRLRGRTLRIVVPVSVRGRDDAGELGNRITFLPVTLPLDVRQPRKLMEVVRRQMVLLKSAHLAELVSLAGAFLGTIPSPLQALLGPLVSQLPLSVCNLIFTNVRGPEAPLYLFGRKMLACYPYVPIGGEMGMNCAVLTYNGTAFFGFTGDAHAVPDLRRFEKLLAVAFAELKHHFAASPSSAKPKRPTRAKTKAKKTREEAASPTEFVPPSQPLPQPPLRGHAAVA